MTQGQYAEKKSSISPLFFSVKFLSGSQATTLLTRLGASLRKNLKFLQNLKTKHLKKIFDKYFCLISAIVIKACHSKVKTITLLHKIV
jgi:hypothetical protein